MLKLLNSDKIPISVSVFKNQQRFKGHAPRCDLWCLKHEEVHMVASSSIYEWILLVNIRDNVP